MRTYQDLLAVGESDKARIDFCLALIKEHKSSKAYKTAVEAEEYDRRQNTTIMNFRRYLTDLNGKQIPDNYSANFKLPSGFFQRFVTQLNQYLLGNGVKMDEDKKALLGKGFDVTLQKMGRKALVQGCVYGFWNSDRIEVFALTEFAPLMDEVTGAIKAGVRFYQIEENKPLSFVLYELDGYTKYIKDKDGERVEEEKKTYEVIRTVTKGGELIDEVGRNYSGFPIIPMYGNTHRQSELVGLQEAIDCYDLIKSGFANDIDEATMVYWLLKNTGGMDKGDIVDFIRQLKMFHGAVVDGDSGVDAEAHTTQPPHEARMQYLEKLERDLYKDAQIVNVSEMTSGNKTATEIIAAYEPQNLKADDFEFCVLEFLEALFELVGIEDTVTFTRSKIVNQLEETQMVLLAAQYLDDEFIIGKLPWITQEEQDELLERRANENINRFQGNE